MPYAFTLCYAASYKNTKSTVFYLLVIYYHPHATISVMYAWGWCCIALCRILELKNSHGKLMVFSFCFADHGSDDQVLLPRAH